MHVACLMDSPDSEVESIPWDTFLPSRFGVSRSVEKNISYGARLFTPATFWSAFFETAFLKDAFDSTDKSRKNILDLSPEHGSKIMGMLDFLTGYRAWDDSPSEYPRLFCVVPAGRKNLMTARDTAISLTAGLLKLFPLNVLCKLSDFLGALPDVPQLTPRSVERSAEKQKTRKRDRDSEGEDEENPHKRSRSSKAKQPKQQNSRKSKYDDNSGSDG